MAYSFGDPQLKLPPIKKEHTVGTISGGEEAHWDRHGLHRDKHGLTRLPPIGRLHSLRPPASHKSYSSTNESQSVTKENSPSEREKLRSQRSSIGSAKNSSLKRMEASNEAERDTKFNGVDFKQSLNDSHMKKTARDGSHMGSSSLCHLELRSISKIPVVSPDEDATPLCNQERTNRRGSMSFPNLRRLKRSSGLAKSSPELSYKRMKKPREEVSVGENSRSASTSVRDVDNAVLFNLRKPDIKWDKMQELRKEGSRNQRGDLFRHPQSSPSSPICSEPATKQKAHRGRKSLNDINDVGQLVQGKRASISPPKKQNLMTDVMGLQIKGRSCPQNERETSRSHATSRHHAESPALHSSLCDDRKPSVHDFHQILKILPTEEGDLKHHKVPSSQSQGMDASVYDLREFLMLAAEASGRQQKNLKSKELTANANHLSPKQDVQSDSPGRKGSVYDLMEFLSLGSGRNSASTSENSSGDASPRGLLSPKEPTGTKAVLSRSQPNDDPRRSSTYSLLEFLSLSPRSAGANPDNETGGQSYETDGLNSQEPDVGRASASKENRSLSLYDLAEFLSMTSGFPPLVRISASDQSAGQQPGAASSSRRGSMYNIQEILSHLEREAEESKLLITPESPNSVGKGGLTPQSPRPTAASSGYSTANNSPQLVEVTVSNDANDSKRSMSVYDLREFLSMYASCQQNPPNQLMFSGPSCRKFSGASQSGVSIQVTDENNQSLDYDFNDDVFQPTGLDSGEGLSKRNSSYDLREFLNLLNCDDSPLRRRLSSVSSGFSEGGNAPGNHGIGSNFGAKENDERPQLSPRQDSEGSLSLYDLNEFLSLLNTDESPLRRRLSSTNDGMGTQAKKQVRSPLLPPPEESPEKGLYNLEEILTALNDSFAEQKRNSESTTIAVENEASPVGEISIQVPQFSSMHDRKNPIRFTVKKTGSLKSFPET